MRITLQKSGLSQGDPAKRYVVEVTGDIIFVTVVLCRCHCGCKRKEWAMAITGPIGCPLDDILVKQILRRLLPHAFMVRKKLHLDDAPPATESVGMIELQPDEAFYVHN